MAHINPYAKLNKRGLPVPEIKSCRCPKPCRYHGSYRHDMFVENNLSTRTCVRMEQNAERGVSNRPRPFRSAATR